METITAKTILQKNKSTGWFGTNYTMNLYKGCCHGCIYCDSRSECYCIDDFDTVRAKENTLQILREELKRKSVCGIIGTGSMSDPYNPFEETELLTRHALQLISEYGLGITVITKSALIKRDADVLLDIMEHSPVLCKMTITAVNDELSKKIEPNVSVSSERFEALAKLAESGIHTCILLMPVLPFIEDNLENITGIVRRAKECGVRCIYPAFGMTLRQNQREYYFRKLDEIFPGQNFTKLYIQKYGNSYECRVPDHEKLWSAFAAECDRLCIKYRMKDIISDYQAGYYDNQLSFF